MKLTMKKIFTKVCTSIKIIYKFGKAPNTSVYIPHFSTKRCLPGVSSLC